MRAVSYLLTFVLFFAALWITQAAIQPLAKFFPRCELVRPYGFACIRN